MARKKGKLQSGTWVQRDLINSRAFWALNGTAKGLLLLFLLKRNMDNKHNCINARNITMTYLELENLFLANQGDKIAGIQVDRALSGYPSGLSRGSITRGLKDLMAKGFILIVRQGGMFKKDKTIYGLCDDWLVWLPGTVVREKPPGNRSGCSSLRRKPLPQPGAENTV